MSDGSQSTLIVEKGNVRIHRIEETTIPMFGLAEFFQNFDPDAHDLSGLRADEFDWTEHKLVLSSASYLVRTPGLTVLIDTGVGNDRDRLRPMFRQLSTPWLECVRSVVDPFEVDIVVSTHLHMDHVGWNTRLVDGVWVPTFPRARYLFNRPEIAALESDAVRASLARNGDFVADSITPIFDAGQAEIIDVPLTLSEHVSFEPAPGDTAGHLVVRIRYGEQTAAIVTGDAFHHVLQLRDPALSSNFSSLPKAAILTRRLLFEESAADGTPLLAGHLASHHVLRTIRAGDAYAPR